MSYTKRYMYKNATDMLHVHLNVGVHACTRTCTCYMYIRANIMQSVSIYQHIQSVPVSIGSMAAVVASPTML